MRRVVVVGYPAAELLDIASVTSTLIMANVFGAAPPYDVVFATPGGRPIICASGLTLAAQATLEHETGPLDTLIVVGGIGCDDAAANPVLIAHFRRLAKVSRRVASVCTGASILAETGLLDGRRATTHWQDAPRLAARHPQITVDPDPIFIRDGALATSAGVTAALDLTLAFIEEDHGAEVARMTSRHLVTYLQRPGNQAQMSMFVKPPAPDGPLSTLTGFIGANLCEDLSTPALARRIGTSERHLTRLFVKHLGLAPARYVREARLEAAARLLETTDLTMAVIAQRTGFGRAESLRQAFTGRFGIAPSRFRKGR
ncbi:GlxA family transcriptional regulator [Herbidospora sp. RD11066]